MVFKYLKILVVVVIDVIRSFERLLFWDLGFSYVVFSCEFF